MDKKDNETIALLDVALTYVINYGVIHYERCKIEDNFDYLLICLDTSGVQNMLESFIIRQRWRIFNLQEHFLAHVQKILRYLLHSISDSLILAPNLREVSIENNSLLIF